MATAATLDHSTDQTDLPLIVRGAVILGAIQSVLVLAVSLVNRGLEGTPDTIVTGVLVALGIGICCVLPAIWIRPRTIDGIAAASGIGLGAALVFLVIDVILLQRIGTYTNRWWAVGGMSNWWYHPVWWMVSAYLSWLGAWVFANQFRARGASSLAGAIVLVAALAVACGALAALVGFPGAAWSLPTFVVAVLPALALATLISGFAGSRR
jgi:hypothetical protein